MKQLGLGVMQYTQDYDETYPKGTSTTNVNSGEGWAGQIQPYIKSRQILKCPSDKFAPTFVVAGQTAPAYACSYYYNNNLSGFFIYSNKITGAVFNTVSHAQLNAPARTVLHWEATSGFYYENPEGSGIIEANSPAGNGNDNRGGTPATGQMSGGYATSNGSALGVGSTPRHFEGANYLAADGHVKWLVSSSVSAGRTGWSGTGAQTTLNNPPSAETATYTGADAHVMTMSPR